MHSKTGRAASAILVAALLSSAAAAVPTGFTKTADQIIERGYPANGPGAAAVVTERGKTVYSGGRGLADIQANRPITAHTVFRLGSITKQFSAAVLMQLVEEGKLSLDDPLSKFFPDYSQPGANATVRQLLNHTSGIQSYTAIPGWMVEENIARPVTTEQMIAVFKDKPSPSKPGEKWEYNNSGYVLVGAIIEKLTGKSWHQAIAERIAAPLKLSTTEFGETRPAAMAIGYSAGDPGATPAMKIHMNVPHAAGGLIGTVGDLATWSHAFHHGKVVNAASYKAMTTGSKTSDGNDNSYGFGLGLEELLGRNAISHSGGIPGFSTNSMYLPDKDLFVAVFTNSNDPTTSSGIMMQRLAAAAIGEPLPTFTEVKADLKALEPLFGVYKIEGKDADRRFFARDGQLFTKRSGASETKVYAAGPNLFFYGPNSLDWFNIKRNASGAPVMEMHPDGAAKAELAVRTGPIPAEAPAFAVPKETLERYVGIYGKPPRVATVEMDPGGQLKMKLGGQEFLPLRATSATEFLPRGVEARVVFKPDGKGLAIHQGGRVLELERP